MLTVDKSTSLIAVIVSDPHQVEIVENLCQDDAQSFIDKIDEASFYAASCLKSSLTLD